jgi:hypothetical protein
MRKLTGRLGRPSPAMIVAIVALFLGLGGGAYAAKKIGTKQLANKSVTTKKLTKIERSQGYFSKQAGEIALPGGTDTAVASLNLPSSGDWQVTANVSLGSTAANGNVRCQLRDDGVVLNAGDTRINSFGPNNFSANVALTWFSDGGLITLTCAPTNGAVARDRVLAATRVARVTSQ